MVPPSACPGLFIPAPLHEVAQCDELASRLERTDFSTGLSAFDLAAVTPCDDVSSRLEAES